MSDFGDIIILKTIHFSPTEMNQFLKIEFSGNDIQKLFFSR